jgi:hypothetical protein
VISSLWSIGFFVFSPFACFCYYELELCSILLKLIIA